MFTLDQLELLLVIVEQGSFSAAARQMKRSPSSVSMAVSSLEDTAGLILFDRTLREPRPTAALLSILPDARVISSRASSLRTRIEQMGDGLETSLTVGIAADVNANRVVHALGAVGSAFPQLEIAIVTKSQEEILQDLVSKDVDVVITYGNPEIPSREMIVGLWTETLMALVAPSHPLAEKADLTIEELHAHRQVIVAGPAIPIKERRSLVAANLWRVGSLNQMFRVVETGQAWANLPASAAKGLLDEKRLVALRFSNIWNGLEQPVFFRSRIGATLGTAACALLRALRDNRLDARMEFELLP